MSIQTGIQETEKLPEGWIKTIVGEISKLIRGVSYTKEHASKIPKTDYIPLLRGTNINSKLTFNDLIYIPSKLVSNEQIVKPFDILLTMSSGSKDLVGKAAQVEQDFHATFGTFCGLIRPFSGINKKFVGMFFQSPYYRHQISKRSSGVNINNLRRIHIENMPFMLPPLEEQDRIVIKAEELLTKLDAGISALKRAKIQLKQYRQSLLKDAFEGKLTEQWRQEHKGEIEPLSALVERIEKIRTNNEINKGPSRSHNAIASPNGWTWITIGEIAEKIQYGSSEKATDDAGGVPVVRMGNIQDGKIIFTNLKYYPIDSPFINEFLLEEGDMLFNRTNSAELVGKSAVYKNYYPKPVFASYLIRVRVNKEMYNASMLSFFINSYYGRKYISSVVSQQVGQANVNGKKLSMMPIPLPSILEQNKIVTELERLLSLSDNTDKVVIESLLQAYKLRQSLLKTAFEGKLVSQVTSNEPATLLLRKIKKAKMDQNKNKDDDQTRLF